VWSALKQENICHTEESCGDSASARIRGPAPYLIP
jgi:hypothetical protein